MVALVSAFWLGMLTAMSPCPLATNIAAISFIGRKSEQKKKVIVSGLLYAVGRTLAYVALSVAITAGVLATASTSRFLQKYMNEALGPLLILLGLVLLGRLGAGLSMNLQSDKLQGKAQQGNAFWSLGLGMLFALSFCPVSAGLFFGAMLPLSVQQESSLLVPIWYGVGTALPVVVFAFLIVFASGSLTKVFNGLSRFEFWLRNVAAIAFIVVGIYYCLTHIYGVVF